MDGAIYTRELMGWDTVMEGVIMEADDIFSDISID